MKSEAAEDASMSDSSSNEEDFPADKPPHLQNILSGKRIAKLDMKEHRLRQIKDDEMLAQQ